MSEKVIVFAGQPNTGKSSWINRLSGSTLTTGNWSGVTIEKTECWTIFDQVTYHLIDLPGIQGLNHQNDEERITEEYLNHHHIDCIVQIIDSCHIESSLSLTIELRKFQIPMICLLNFEDEAHKYQIHIDCDKLTKRFSIPFISCSAIEQNNNDQIMNWIKRQSHQKVSYRPLLNPKADQIFESLLQWHSMKEAIALFDSQYPELSSKEKHAAVKSCMNYVKGDINQRNSQILKIDRFILCSFLGNLMLICTLIVLFLCILLIGGVFSDITVLLMEKMKSALLRYTNELPQQFQSYLKNVVFEGVGSLFSFVPLLGGFYLLTSIMEESGIMARISLLMDSMMRCFHLTGKSFITFLVAHGCNVPAVVHSTSLENEAIRKKTALLVPFCSCTARLPVYFLFIKTLFGNKGIIVCVLLYGTGILTVLLLSFLLERYSKSKIPDAQIIELVPYRIPDYRLILKKTRRHLSHYLSKIMTTMLTVLTIVWVLMNLSLNGSQSLFVQISKSISGVFVPLGFGYHWIYTAALIPGCIAKEAVAGTLMMLMTMSGESLSPLISVNLSYLVYTALTIPCTMTLTAIQDKYGMAMAICSFLLSFCVSYIVTWLMVQFIMFF